MSNSQGSFFTRELLQVAADLLLLKEAALTVPDHEDARDNRRWVGSGVRPHCPKLAVITFDPGMNPSLLEFSKKFSPVLIS